MNFIAWEDQASHIEVPMDWSPGRADIGDRDIYCLLCRERVIGLDLYYMFPRLSRVDIGTLLRTVYYMFSAIECVLQVTDEGATFPGTIAKHMDLERKMTLWATAKCGVNCILWLAIICKFGNADPWRNYVHLATILSSQICFLRLNFFCYSIS